MKFYSPWILSECFASHYELCHYKIFVIAETYFENLENYGPTSKYYQTILNKFAGFGTIKCIRQFASFRCISWCAKFLQRFLQILH